MQIRKLAGSMVLGGAMALLLAVPSANAAVISFDQVEDGGTVTDIGGGDFTGEDIIFERIQFEGQSAFCGNVVADDGSTNTNCFLNFDTSTGFFELSAPSGLFDEDGNLIPGTLDSIVITGTGFDTVVGVDGIIFTAIGTDTKLQALLDYFEIPLTDQDEFHFANTEILLGEPTEAGNVIEADLSNSDVPFDAPEPGLLTLFGLGLLGIGRKVAKRRP